MTTKSVVTNAVVAAVKEAAASPSNDLQAKDVGAVAKTVSENITPLVEHATNNEPWYQSRVTWGAIIAAIGATYTLITDFSDGTPPNVEIFTAQAGVIVGALTTIYGRYVATKPIGA